MKGVGSMGVCGGGQGRDLASGQDIPCPVNQGSKRLRSQDCGYLRVPPFATSFPPKTPPHTPPHLEDGGLPLPEQRLVTQIWIGPQHHLHKRGEVHQPRINPAEEQRAGDNLLGLGEGA